MADHSTQPETEPEVIEVDAENNPFKSDGFELFAKLFGATMDQTAKLNNSVIAGYKSQAERQTEGLKKALAMMPYLEREIPYSSAGGEIFRDLYDVLHEALYGKYQ